MSFNITSPSELDDAKELDTMIVEYYGVVLEKLQQAGGPDHLKPEDMMDSFRSKIHVYMPPSGQLTLVHNSADNLVGCSMMNQVRPDSGELKRLYVRAQANGHGLGQRILNTQFNQARHMGWKSILINVIKGNRDMLRLSERVGFRYIDRYPECDDPPELADYFVYMKYDLT